MGRCIHLPTRGIVVVKELACRDPLYHIAGCVDLGIGQTYGGDNAVTSSFGRTEVDEEHLVFLMVDNFTEGLFEFDFFARRQVTLENGVLQVIAKIFARLECKTEPLAFGNVIADEIGGAHGLSGEEGYVLRDFAGQGFAEQPSLEFERSAVADFVVEDGMGQERAHALFVDLEEAFASRRGEVDGIARPDKVVFGNDAVIDAVQNGRFGNERAELFHEIESQRGAAETWLVIESNVGVETDGEARQGAIFAEHAVAEREERIDGVGGRAAVAGGKIESRQWRDL